MLVGDNASFAELFEIQERSVGPDIGKNLAKHGKTFYAMAPEYTYDGGHLNELGRKKVAEQLLILLANLN